MACDTWCREIRDELELHATGLQELADSFQGWLMTSPSELLRIIRHAIESYLRYKTRIHELCPNLFVVVKFDSYDSVSISFGK